MRYVLGFAILFAQVATAQQYGLGMIPGQQCPQNYNMGNGAYNNQDPIQNLQGQLTNAQQKLAQRQQKLERINKYIDRARSDMGTVIRSQSAIDEIAKHYEYNSGPDSYQETCRRDSVRTKSGSAGGQRANVSRRSNRNSRAKDNSGRYAVAGVFCDIDENGKIVNNWDAIVEDKGLVSEAVCDYEIPTNQDGELPDDRRVRKCRQGLKDFYEQMNEREKLEKEMARIEEAIDQFSRRGEKISDAIADGTYCPTCGVNQRFGSNQGAGNIAPQFLPMLQNYQRQQMAMRQNYPGTAMGYPGAAYAAPVPGYAGINPGFGNGLGTYGAVPGGVGPGAFGCMGANNGFGDPFGQQFQPYQNMQHNPFNNPFQQNMFDPRAFNGGFNPMLNGGLGPGGFNAQLGNGLFDPWNQNMYRPGMNAPQVLPRLGGNNFGRPGFFNQPYNFQAGIAPWGNNFGMPGGGYNFGYGQAPGIINAGAGFGNPMANLNYQMGLLNNQVSYLGGSSFAGSFGAPPVIYPQFGGGMPQPLPAFGGGGGIPQPAIANPINPALPAKAGNAPTVVTPGR